MLAGLFLQNYKCYSNINFIPLADHPDTKLNIFIGPNGAGKSAILESLNCIFNNVPSKEWETTAEKKKDRTSICHVFLIKKAEFLKDEIIESISDCFWNYDFSTLGNAESTSKFISFRENLKRQAPPEEYYLLAIGKNYEGEIILTTTFDKKISDKTRRFGTSRSYINDLFRKLINSYSYVYIPVENRISDVLKLQAKEMQSLMDKSLIEEIKQILETKKSEPGSKAKGKSLLDLINEELNEYTRNINEKLLPGYEFKAKTIIKKTIKTSDIIDIIFKEYFQVRPLTKDGKHISSLSSGQQRLALIDVATTLLSTENRKTKDIILAIDEPESSLEPANCYEQFDRLLRVSTVFGRQLLITTHWYGLLLNPSKGILTHIEPIKGKNPTHNSYSLQSIHEERRSFPNSIEMKSYFDLMSAMLSILKSKDYTWVFCEGSEDANYLRLYLAKELSRETFNKTIILPFNGSGNIKKLFDLLSLPLQDESELNLIKGKIILLIDTDEKHPIRIEGYKPSKFKNKLLFYRLSLDRENDSCKIISVADVNATNTVIEDTLHPIAFWNSLNEIANEHETLKSLLELYDPNPQAENSDITRSQAFLVPKEKEGYQRKKEITDLVYSNEMKKLISTIYHKHCDDHPTPKWISSLADYIRA